LVPNTSHGVIDIAMCLPWQPGDRVVLFDGEFPTNVTPWQRAAELFGLELVWVPLAPFHRSLDEGVAEVERVVARGARLVAVSVAQFTTGLRMPVERIGAICQRHGCELFVDAIQGAGALPIEVEEASIDYLTAGGHKWLMGPEGAGFVYVAPHRVRELVPRVAGWLSHEDPLAFLFAPNELRYDRAIKKRASMFEPGAQNSVGYAGLEASVDCLLQLGPKAIFDQVQRYFDRVEGPLQELGLRSLRHREMAGRSTILSFELPDAQRTGELVQALGRRGIVCTGPDGLLRLAPHWPNDAGEASSVVEAAREALRAMGL
jgi:selenocysteine lyase/cysteine desulfurase